ncbi:MAG: hypothetical protein IIX56_00320, partial [Treponema sp.]|nr:hypothetical protein [Treponema sp.]
SSAQRINLIPAYEPEALTVPIVASKNKENPLEDVKINLVLPEKMKGKTVAGEKCGAIEYWMGEHLLESIPLICEKSEKKANFWVSAADMLASLTL